MATSQPSLSNLDPADELGSYRTLSAAAVASFALGLLSSLSFAPWRALWVVPPLALLFGWLALRKIRKAPEEWTGKRLAQAGMVMAALFGISAAGTGYAETAVTKKVLRAVADR